MSLLTPEYNEGASNREVAGVQPEKLPAPWQSRELFKCPPREANNPGKFNHPPHSRLRSPSILRLPAQP